MALTFAKIAVTYRLQKSVNNPCFFFGIKARFESALRSASGCEETDCLCCRRGISCAVSPIFSQALTADPSAIKRYQKPSLPFVLHVPMVPKMPNKGAHIEFAVILLGPAAEHYASFVEALSAVVRGHLTLVKAESVDYTGNRYLLVEDRERPHDDCLFLFSADDLQRGYGHGSNAISIRFLTPLVLLVNGRPLRQLSFSPLIRALFRRVSSLAYYYGGAEMGCDFKSLAEESLAVTTTESDLAWTEWKVSPEGGVVAGITGQVRFSGDLEPYYWFLVLGQYLNVGKGATYGRGEFVLK